MRLGSRGRRAAAQLAGGKARQRERHARAQELRPSAREWSELPSRLACHVGWGCGRGPTPAPDAEVLIWCRLTAVDVMLSLDAPARPPPLPPRAPAPRIGAGSCPPLQLGTTSYARWCGWSPGSSPRARNSGSTGRAAPGAARAIWSSRWSAPVPPSAHLVPTSGAGRRWGPACAALRGRGAASSVTRAGCVGDGGERPAGRAVPAAGVTGRRGAPARPTGHPHDRPGDGRARAGSAGALAVASGVPDRAASEQGAVLRPLQDRLWTLGELWETTAVPRNPHAAPGARRVVRRGARHPAS